MNSNLLFRSFRLFYAVLNWFPQVHKTGLKPSQFRRPTKTIKPAYDSLR